jgi:ATP-binding cassette, subfamily C, bacterial CydC
MTLRRLLELAATRRRWIVAGAALGAVGIGANVALVGVSAYLISKSALVTSVAEVALAITSVRVLAIARAAFRYLERYVTHAAVLRSLADLRVWFYASIEPLAPARLVTRRSGDLVGRIVADIDTLERFPVRVLAPLITAVAVAAIACLALGLLDPAIGIVLALFLAVAGVLLPLVTRRMARLHGAGLVTGRARFGALAVDHIGGLADLVALDQSGAHVAGALAEGMALDRTRERLAVPRAINVALGSLLTSLCGVTVLAMAIALVESGRLDGVLLAALPLAAIATFEAAQPLSQAFESLEMSRAAAGRLVELTDVASPVVDRTTTTSEPSDHAIDIVDLCFRYGPGEPLAIDGLDLSVPAGTCVALVGPSGTGKTTLLNLLLRFWEFESGEIRLGGRDIRDVAGDGVRRSMSVVPQRVDLFDATIRDNLALADGDVTDERIEAAARQAQLHDVITALPDGYATRIGEDGVRLSGGERRRLAIARAIIKDAPIVLLDEPTADLDALTERRLVASIRPFLDGRTVLLVTHSPGFVALAHRVVRLDGEGRLAGLPVPAGIAQPIP